MRPVLLSFFLAFNLPASTQPILKIDIDSLVEEFMFVHPSLPPPVFFVAENVPHLIPAFIQYVNHADENIRRRAYLMCHVLTGKRQSDSLQAKVAELLLDACMDSSYSIRSYFSEHLYVYPKESLSENFVKKLKTILHNLKWLNHHHFRLAGYLDLQGEKEYIRNFVVMEKEGHVPIPSGYFTSLDWNARLALARMGDQTQVEYVRKVITEQESEYDKVIFLFKYLSYVRHPKTIDIIIQYLYSEERLPSTGKYDSGEHYTLRALEILSRIIKDFPVRQTDSYMYNTEDVLLARQWMQEHRNDYELSFDSFY